MSCPGCNTKKGDDKVLNKVIVRYPKHSKNVTIIHAHYDDYYAHIKINNDMVFEALSKKGSHTITICELFRLKKVEAKAKNIISSRSKSSTLVAQAMKADATELIEIMKVIQQRIK